MEKVTVELLSPFRVHPKGACIELPSGIAKTLVDFRRATYAGSAPKKVTKKATKKTKKKPADSDSLRDVESTGEAEG